MDLGKIPPDQQPQPLAAGMEQQRPDNTIRIGPPGTVDTEVGLDMCEVS